MTGDLGFALKSFNNNKTEINKASVAKSGCPRNSGIQVTGVHYAAVATFMYIRKFSQFFF